MFVTMTSKRNLRNRTADIPDQEDGDYPQCISEPISQRAENIAVVVEGEERNENEQTGGHQLLLGEKVLAIQGTSSDLGKTSQDPLLKIIELLQANKQETIGVKESFQAENIKLTEQFSNNIKQLTSAIREVKEDFRNAMQELSSKFDDKLEKASADFNNRTDGLGKAVENKTKELSDEMNTMQKDLRASVENVRQEMNQFRQETTEEINVRQGNMGEHIDRVKNRLEKQTASNIANISRQVNDLRTQLSEVSEGRIRSADQDTRSVSRQSTPQQEASGNNPSTSTQAVDDLNIRHENEQGIDGMHATCETNAHCVNASHVRESTYPNIQFGTPLNYIAASEIPCPIFDDSSDQNAVLHLSYLDDYFNIKVIPKHLQLAIAIRTIKGCIGKSWIHATAGGFKDYEDFKAAFVNQFWNQDSQSRARCSIYQAKYHRHENESMSDHLLRFAALAKLLQPKMTDAELLSAMRNHYSVVIQRNWVTAQIRDVQGAVTFLKQMESIEENDPNRKADHNASNRTDSNEYGARRQNNFKHINRGNNNRNPGHIPVRHMQISRQHTYQNGRHYQQPFFNRGQQNQSRNNNREDPRQYRGGDGSNLNPDAPIFNTPSDNREPKFQQPRPSTSRDTENL